MDKTVFSRIHDRINCWQLTTIGIVMGLSLPAFMEPSSALATRTKLIGLCSLFTFFFHLSRNRANTLQAHYDMREMEIKSNSTLESRKKEINKFIGDIEQCDNVTAPFKVFMVNPLK